MITPVTTTAPDATVRHVANQLVCHHFSGMPVTDSEEKVIGVVTEADIIRVLLDGEDLSKITADDVMSRQPITLEAEADISEAMELLTDHRIVRVPVTHKGKLVGIVSRSDVIRGVLHIGM